MDVRVPVRNVCCDVADDKASQVVGFFFSKSVMKVL
jgi:hypothetical protein